MADKPKVIIEGEADEKLDRSEIAKEQVTVSEEMSRVASDLQKVDSDSEVTSEMERVNVELLKAAPNAH
jgi:hypothetical protein